MKELNGREIADYMKNNQVHSVKSLISRKVHPKLVIIRDNSNPVIEKYVQLKQRYGEDIGVIVEDWLGKNVRELIEKANRDTSVHGVIVQLPLQQSEQLDAVLNMIAPEKDVDGLNNYSLHDIKSGDFRGDSELKITKKYSSDDIITGVIRGNIDGKNYSSDDINSEEPVFESATATAINWLLAGYDIDLEHKRIAIVGRGRLVGAPLARMWCNSGYQVEVFHRGSDLERLRDFEVIVSATGVPRLITSEMVKPGAVVVDAGTASEKSGLVGDVDDEVRKRDDLKALTPRIGGVGPLTVTALFEHVIIAAEQSINKKGLNIKCL